MAVGHDNIIDYTDWAYSNRYSYFPVRCSKVHIKLVDSFHASSGLQVCISYYMFLHQGRPYPNIPIAKVLGELED